MKIAFIVSVFPSLSETFILDQITGLLDMGHDVEIFAGFDPKEKKVHPDIETYRLVERTHYVMPANKIHRVLRAVYLVVTNFHNSPIRILKSLNIYKYGNDALSLKLLYISILFLGKRFDIIHCHFGQNGVIGSYLKETGVSGKYITSFHGYDVNSYPKIAGKNVYSNLFSNLDIFTCNTNFTKEQVIKLGCDGKKIMILPVGLRIEKFRFIGRKIQGEAPIRILTVGRLIEKKGHEYALKAIAKVTERYRNIEYIIAGDGPLRNELENLAFRLRIKNYVTFLGAVEQDELLKLYESGHIFLLSSVTASDGDREGQALVLQEAQSVGLPIISTLHNGIPEGVLDGRSAFLVPERDVDALAKKIEYLLEHPELWPGMGRYGRKLVEEKYDITRLNQKLVAIYESLLTNNVNI